MPPVYYGQIRYNLVETARMIALAQPALDEATLQVCRRDLDALHETVLGATRFANDEDSRIARSFAFTGVMDKIFGVVPARAECGVVGIVVKDCERTMELDGRFPKGSAVSREGAAR